MKLFIVDALASESATPELEVNNLTTLAECRALAVSLPLASCTRALSGGCALCICHNGCILEAADEESVTLAQLGVLTSPIFVVLARAVGTKQVDGGGSPPTAWAAPAAAAVAAAAAAAPASAAAATTAATTWVEPQRMEPPVDATCRICFGAAFEDGAGKLFAPCLCAGSSKYVHVNCLNEWRANSANPRSFYRCDQCHYEYNVQRTEWAAWLESDRVVRSSAVALLIVATLTSAVLLGPLGAARRFYRLIDFNPSIPSHSGPLFASYWDYPLDYLVSGLLGVALAGFYKSIRDAYVGARHMEVRAPCLQPPCIEREPRPSS